MLLSFDLWFVIITKNMVLAYTITNLESWVTVSIKAFCVELKTSIHSSETSFLSYCLMLTVSFFSPPLPSSRKNIASKFASREASLPIQEV